MLRKAIVGAVLMVMVLWAGPTTVRIGMLLAPALANGGVLAVTPTGQVVLAGVGSGVTLVANGGSYSIQAATPNVVVGAKPVRQADGTYLLPQAATAASLRVYRNGVRQSAGDDYTYDATAMKISPVAGYAWDASDLVLADFAY